MEINQGAKVSICVLTHNRISLLRNLLLSLRHLKYAPLEIILIDNHSQDETQQMLNTECRDVKYVRMEKNIGAGARNIGMKAAAGDIIITLDDDIIGFDDSCIASLVKLFNERPKLGAVNFRIMAQSTGAICNWVHHCEPEKYWNKEFLTYEITEGAVAFRRAALEDSGYYPESFFLSHEGPDLALRMLDCGYEVIYSNLVSVTHLHSTLGRKEWLNYYFDTRNQIWLAARIFPLPYALTYLSRGLSSMLIYSIRDGFFWYWVKAMIDGVRGLNNALKTRKVLSNNGITLIKSINRKKPGLAYLIKNRLCKKNIRL